MLIRVVKREIASLYNVLLEKIVEVNQVLNPDRFLIGQALMILTDKNGHIVKPGENLFQIVQLYRMSLQELLQMNQLYDSNYIYSVMLLIVSVDKPFIDVNAYKNTTGGAAGKLILEVGEG